VGVTDRRTTLRSSVATRERKAAASGAVLTPEHQQLSGVPVGEVEGSPGSSGPEDTVSLQSLNQASQLPKSPAGPPGPSLDASTSSSHNFAAGLSSTVTSNDLPTSRLEKFRKYWPLFATPPKGKWSRNKAVGAIEKDGLEIDANDVRRIRETIIHRERKAADRFKRPRLHEETEDPKISDVSDLMRNMARSAQQIKTIIQSIDDGLDE
jgi:hypothetical protein